jgi:hypothetical protein
LALHLVEALEQNERLLAAESRSRGCGEPLPLANADQDLSGQQAPDL